MTWDDAIRSLAADGHSHAGRYRELCADDSDPERRDAMRALVVSLATGQPLQGQPAPVRVSYGDPAPRRCCG